MFRGVTSEVLIFHFLKSLDSGYILKYVQNTDQTELVTPILIDPTSVITLGERVVRYDVLHA